MGAHPPAVVPALPALPLHALAMLFRSLLLACLFTESARDGFSAACIAFDLQKPVAAVVPALTASGMALPLHASPMLANHSPESLAA